MAINFGVFISALLFLVATIFQSMLLMFLALISAIVTQRIYRKKYPKTNKSWRELIAEKHQKD
ncbi:MULTISPECIES: hypothetical protein [Listeria]|uniref:hypothetical protein n=1 Tax=Listeria TaxID=1637 RepID=UPI000B58F330|nr:MULTISPECIES: hypothetical protein [Listeria]